MTEQEYANLDQLMAGVFKKAEQKARIMLYLAMGLSFLVGCAVGVLIL